MTTGSGAGTAQTAGGPARHIPVLRAEIINALQPHAGGTYLDGTFGAGGYSRALLAVEGTRVLALDRDPDAIAAGQALVGEAQGRLTLIEACFGSLDVVARQAGFAGFDGVVLDIGVSSMQLDEAARGFSFRFEGPLDMRMAKSGQSAADLVNTADADALADIFYHFGEERASRRIARAIVHDRVATPFTTTTALAGLIKRLMPGKPGDIHPATRVFQALRIAVNDELGELLRALYAAERVLKPGGRLVVVAFHSLEDRIVKQFLTTRSGRGPAVSRHMPDASVQVPPAFSLPGKQPVTASPLELQDNPRARSARLRIGERTDAGAGAQDIRLAALASLPAPIAGRR